MKRPFLGGFRGASPANGIFDKWHARADQCFPNTRSRRMFFVRSASRGRAMDEKERRTIPLPRASGMKPTTHNIIRTARGEAHEKAMGPAAGRDTKMMAGRSTVPRPRDRVGVRGCDAIPPVRMMACFVTAASKGMIDKHLIGFVCLSS